MEPVGATSVFLFALLTAVATGLGAVPFAFAKHPTRRWLGVSNAVAAGLMLAASFGLIYEGMHYGPLRALVGALLGLVFIVVARRSLQHEEHPAVFASMSGEHERFRRPQGAAHRRRHDDTLVHRGGGDRGVFRWGPGPRPVHKPGSGRPQHTRRARHQPGTRAARGALGSCRILEHLLQPAPAPDGGAGVLLRRGLPAAAALRVGLRGGGHDLDGLLRARARLPRRDLEQPRSGGDHGLSRRHGGFSGPYPVGISTTRSTRRNAAEDGQHGWDEPSSLLRKSCLCDSKFPV